MGWIYDFLCRFTFCSLVLFVGVYVAVCVLIAYFAYFGILASLGLMTFLGRLVKSATIVEFVKTLKGDLNELK